MVKVISVISWQSVLLVEELEYPEKTTYLPKTQNKSRTSQLFTFAYSWITVVWLQMINFLYKEYDSSYMYCKEFYKVPV
jgi:hypothetical protein